MTVFNGVSLGRWIESLGVFLQQPSQRLQLIKLLFEVILGIIFFGLVILAGAGFFAASSETLDAVRSFWPHLAVVMIGVCLVWAVFARAWRLLLLLPVPLSLLAWALSPLSILPSVASPPAHAESTEIKLISFNVLNENYLRSGEVIAFLNRENADFALILESASMMHRIAELKDRYPYITDCLSHTPAFWYCDLILISQHPLRNVRRPLLASGKDRLIIAEATVRGQDVTIVAVHLTKLLIAGQQRREVEALAPLIRSLPRPVIVAGDFNATPWSHTMEHLTEIANVDFTYGYNSTWPSRFSELGIPIDHVLSSGSLAIRRVCSPASAFGSNHRPVIATFTILE